MNIRVRLCLLLVAFSAVSVGCSPSAATLELITTARQGLKMAAEAQESQHAVLMRQYWSQVSALDAAFDADVRLAAGGQIKDSDGQAVPLSADWVISARRGYAAARDALAHQARSAELAHATNTDNLRAADELLEMASSLIIQQLQIGLEIREKLLAIYGRSGDE